MFDFGEQIADCRIAFGLLKIIHPILVAMTFPLSKGSIVV